MKQLNFKMLLLFVLPFTAHAQWSSDTVNRNPICIVNGQQINQQLCNDGTNGAFIVWEDLRLSKSAIYAQWIDSGGYIHWPVNGLCISDTGASIYGSGTPSIASDGAGGCYIVWSFDGSITNSYAQRYGRDGKPVWKNNVPVDIANENRSPIATPDGHGGVIINFYKYNGAVPVMVQWLDSTGRNYLPSGGLQIDHYNAIHYHNKLATDGNYNAYVAFGDNDTFRVVKIDTTGAFPWGPDGKVLSRSFDNYVTNYNISGNAKDGIIIGWDDERNVALRDDLYAQKFDTAGVAKWQPGGLCVDSATRSHTYVYTTMDEMGGAYFTFGYGTVNNQRVRNNGSVAWADVVHVDTPSFGDNYPAVAADGYNGLIAAWDDGRDGTGVYAQRIDTAGHYLWQAHGAPVHTEYVAGNATGTQIISLRNGYAIAAMGIAQTSTGVDVVAAKFTGMITQVVATGIVSETNASAWGVYPNPTTGQVYIRNVGNTSALTTIQVFNEMGQLVSQQKQQFFAGNAQNLNLQEVPAGIYFVKLNSDNAASTVRIVKE